MYMPKYKEIVKMCKGCKHFRSFTDIKTSRRYCNYLLDTGEPRGSPPQECTHKENIKEDDDMKGKKTSDETITKIKELHGQGANIHTIADIAKVGENTVRRVLKKAEPAPSANGTSSEEKNPTTDIIPEIPADVNPSRKFPIWQQDNHKNTIPEAVKEACFRMREEQLAKIEAALEDIKVYRQQVDEINNFLMEEDPP